jgi:nicotinate-nucleotide pyrophosphorylase (carboxylating)
MAAADLLPTHVIVDDLDRWVIEDGLEDGDVTSEALIDVDAPAEAPLVAREPMVVCGLEPLSRGLGTRSYDLALTPSLDEGDRAGPGDVLATLSGDRRTMLALERTVLNVLGRTCGVASLTRQYVDAVTQTRAVITDTRKTMPGFRRWDKYAVVCGGGTSHRMGLHDAVLFKDNHFADLPGGDMAGALAAAIARARANRDLSFVEVEVDTLEQLDVVLGVPGVDIVLLDNMPPDVLSAAAARRSDAAPAVLLEASGGITLETVREVAETGVDRIAIGSLTRGAVMLDIGLDA